MSKIARIYQGINEIQKYYQGGVLQRLFFDWKHYIGNELNIEYAKECTGRNVVISGKTYQNLLNGIRKVSPLWSETDDSYSLDIQTSQPMVIHYSTLIKPLTTYTLIINITDYTTGVIHIGIINNTSDTTIQVASDEKQIYGKGVHKVTLTTKNNIVDSYIRIFPRANTQNTYSISKNILLLEGDYTNTDLPTSIDGIESIGEREFVKSKNLCPYLEKGSIGNKGEETNTSVDVRSPFIHLNAGTYVTSNAGVVRATHIYIYNLNKQFEEKLSGVTTFSLDSNKYVRLHGASSDRDKFQLELGNTPTDYEPFYEYYPVTIRNYNYKCETDNIVLSDGTKNEIIYNGEKHIHIRKIDKIVLDGSDDENWYINDGNQFNLKNSDSLPKDNYYKEIGKHFDKIIASVKPTSHSNLDNATGYGINYTYFFRLNLEEVDATNGATVDDLRAYLKENPITCYLEFSNYIETELYFSDITYKLNEPLRSLPNGVCDTIEEGKIVRRVGKDIIDGTQDLILDNYNITQTLRVYFDIDNAKNSKGNNNLLCNWFIREGDHDDYEYIIIQYKHTQNAVFISVLKSKLESADLNGMKKYFSENPLPFYYELATPIETEITPDMILINGEPITDTVGIELPDGTCDSIENDYYVKRVEKIIFDENIKHYQTLMIVNNNVIIRTRKFSMAIGDGNIISNVTVISWMHDKNNLEEVTETKIMAISSASDWNEANIIIPSSYFEGDITIEVVKEFLAENPVTMYYELMTPIKIPLFSIKEGLTTLKSTNNITPQIELDCLVRDDFQNLCDNIWESGDINLGGVNYDNINRIRLVNYIELKPNTIYRLDITNSVPILNTGLIGARFYDSSKKYLGNDLAGNIKSPTYTFTTPADCYYIRFIAETRDTNFKIYLKEVF